jgi:predicted RNA-binding Zn ribbon-like protein
VDLDVPRAPISLTSLAGVHDLRDAFRGLAALVTADDRTRVIADQSVTAAIRTLNTVAAQSASISRLRLHSFTLERLVAGSGTALQSALSVLANEAMELFTSSDSELLAACGGPGCVLYFMKDHTRRNWCGDACGNRARAARHYRKVRAI